MRRRRGSVQPDAARAGAGEDSRRRRLPRAGLPGRSVFRCRPRRAVHDWRAPHHHDVRARLSRAGHGSAASPRRLVPDATRGRSRPPGVGGPARRPEPDAGADHRRRRGLHGLHVGHDGGAQGGDEHPQKRRFRYFGLPKVDRVHQGGRDSRPRAAVSRHRAHRPRGAGSPDRKPADPVLPVRRGRSLPARRDPSGDVHGVGSHGVHRAPQQQRDGQARPVLADEGLHRRRADAAGGSGRMARAHRHPHPADVRSDRSDVADAHDSPRRRRPHRPAIGCDVDGDTRCSTPRSGL